MSLDAKESRLADKPNENDPLRERTSPARSNLLALAAQLARMQRVNRSDGTQLGDLYLLELGIEKMGVEWLVADLTRRRREQCYVVIATSALAKRRHDVSVAPGQPGGPTIIRPDIGLWVDSGELARMGRLTGAVSRTVLHKTREKVNAPPCDEQGTRRDSRIRELLCSIRDSARALFGTHQEREAPVVFLIGSVTKAKTEDTQYSLAALRTEAYAQSMRKEAQVAWVFRLRELEHEAVLTDRLQTLFVHTTRHATSVAQDQRASAIALWDEVCFTPPGDEAFFTQLRELPGRRFRYETAHVVRAVKSSRFNQRDSCRDEPQWPQRQEQPQRQEKIDAAYFHRCIQLGYALASSLNGIYSRTGCGSSGLKLVLEEDGLRWLCLLDEDGARMDTARVPLSAALRPTQTLSNGIHALGRLLRQLLFERHRPAGTESRLSCTLDCPPGTQAAEHSPDQEHLMAAYQRCWLLVKSLCQPCGAERVSIHCILEELAQINLSLVMVYAVRVPAAVQQPNKAFEHYFESLHMAGLCGRQSVQPVRNGSWGIEVHRAEPDRQCMQRDWRSQN